MDVVAQVHWLSCELAVPKDAVFIVLINYTNKHNSEKKALFLNYYRLIVLFKNSYKSIDL